MNSINKNEVRLANLEAAAEMRRAELMAIRQPLSLAIAKVINDAIAASGSTKYALRLDDGGFLRDFECMTIDGKDDGDRLVSIDLYYRHDTWEDRRNGKPRILAFSTCGFGTVKAGDTKGVAYCLLLGYLAAHLKEMEDAINAIPEWAAYERALEIYNVSRDEAGDFAALLKEEAHAAALAKVEERLVVGAEVAFSYDVMYDFDRHVDVVKGVHTRKVEKVTNKLVFFENEYKQYKKADVLADLVRGLDNHGWSFAADVDMSRFPFDEAR